MKKLLALSILVSILVITSIAMVIANGNSGAIWTTRNDCGDISQDVNHYARGEKVYINGKNFDAEDNDNDWSITGQPGGASCDPMIVVAFGDYTVDSSGAFCFEAYTVNLDDCGEYKVDFGGKNDNYRVDLDVPVVPEFGMIAGLATILGSVGLFFFIRKK